MEQFKPYSLFHPQGLFIQIDSCLLEISSKILSQMLHILLCIAIPEDSFKGETDCKVLTFYFVLLGNSTINVFQLSKNEI